MEGGCAVILAWKLGDELRLFVDEFVQNSCPDTLKTVALDRILPI
jgi:hypothetical protein